MPAFRFVVRQSINTAGVTYKWSNAYYVSLNAIGEGIGAAQVIMEAQRNVLHTAAQVNETYITDLDQTTTQYITVPKEGAQRGLHTSSSEFMPSFVVMRVDLLLATLGRPSRKFLRFPMTEGDIVNGDSAGATVQSAITAWFNAIVSSVAWVDESNNQIIAAGSPRVSSKRLGREAGLNVPIQAGT